AHHLRKHAGRHSFGVLLWLIATTWPPFVETKKDAFSSRAKPRAVSDDSIAHNVHPARNKTQRGTIGHAPSALSRRILLPPTSACRPRRAEKAIKGRSP